MAVSKNVILLEIIFLITLCSCSNNSTLNEEQNSRNEEIARLTALGMVEAELFYDLMHTENFSKNCSNRLEKMNSTHKGVFNALNGLFLIGHTRKTGQELFNILYEEVTAKYERNNLSAVISFEDCFSIMHYTSHGFERIMAETDEGRQMRNAFYRLAIVQSKDPNKYHNSILYRGQSELDTWYEKRYVKNTTERLKRFTSTSLDDYVAAKYAQERDNNTDMTSTLYEMHFPSPFLSANIDNITYFSYEKETVLLPDTKLFVNNRTIFEKKTFFAYGDPDAIDLRIIVTHDDENLSIFEQQKRVMIKLKELKDSGTKFYVDC
ncbi:uncharacterized protein LOC127281596 [Leptopilina boulardi]|uniref:uncharacterized protein LOC127281596 n=1 Tax=Leptopilina boulardi TaxID=63433 RepID=UPI0021F64C52|nr:uncharacterized protein LOC127281596 [Leptopilina boulardi]XP_051161331.1 uncharacterized protein LOC127281596 [Leptopilina boulardi]